MHTGLPAAPLRQTPSAIRDDRFTRCPFPAATTDAPVAPVRSSNTAMEHQNCCTDLRHPELLDACCPYSSVQGKLVVQHPSRTKKVGKLPPLRSFSFLTLRPIGLVLATPLTVCLVVLGRHVERLAFLDVMFGDRPALSPPEIFYQRMLAGDPTEAAEKAEQFLKERSLSSYYDDVALKGLQLAQIDLDREVLDISRLLRIRDTVVEFTDDLSDQTIDQEPIDGQATNDVEAVAAVEQVATEPAYSCLAVLQAADLKPEW